MKAALSEGLGDKVILAVDAVAFTRGARCGFLVTGQGIELR